MSERSNWKVSTAYKFRIVVVNSAGSRVTGLVNTDFTKRLDADGTNSAVTVTVSEVSAANQPGHYDVAYTPNATGRWTCDVSHATYGAWLDDTQVYNRDQDDLAYSAGSIASVTGAVGSVTGAVGSVTGSVGSVTGAVGSVTGAVGSVTGNVGGNVTGSVGSLATQAKTDVEGAVWDAARASHTAAGSFGQGAASVQGNVTGAVGSVTGAVGSVAGAVGSVTGDVGGKVLGGGASSLAGVGVQADTRQWLGTAPNALVSGRVDADASGLGYTSARATKLDNLDATVSSRLAGASYTAPLSSGQTEAAVWDAARASHTAAGSFGEGLGVPVRSGAISDGAPGSTGFVTDLTDTADDVWRGALLIMTSGSLAGQYALVTAYAGATKRVTFGDRYLANGTAAPSNGDKFVIVPGMSAWDSLRTQHAISGSFGPQLDAAITSRLAAVSYSAPLTSGQTATAVWDAARASHTVVGSFGEALDAKVSSVGGASAATIAAAVWDEAAAGHATAGTFGARVDAAVSSRLASSSYVGPLDAPGTAAAVWGAARASYAAAGTFGEALDAQVSTRLASASYTAPPSAATVAGAVWDEAAAGHVAGGSFGARVDAAVSSRASGADYTAGRAAALDLLDVAISTRLASASYSAPPSAATIAGAVWDEPAVGHATAGTFGPVLDAAISTRAAAVDYTALRAAKIDNLDALVSSRLAPAVAGRPLAVDAVGKVDVATIAVAALDAVQFTAGALAAIAQQVLKEPLANAEAAASFRSLAGAVAKLVNKVEVLAGTLKVYKTDDVTVLGQQALTSDSAADPIVAADTV